MRRRGPDGLALLGLDRPRTPDEDRALADACREAIADYRAAVLDGAPARLQTERARKAFLHLGGDPARSSASLKDYDHARHGPFLGVSDEGSAAGAIREAAFESPKVRAHPKHAPRTPLMVGVAVDAERLGGVGEVNVGPEEYADIWLQCVDRVLVTTNIGTRVNMRVFRREPLVVVKSDSEKAVAAAKAEIAKAFQPFVETPDKKPRPLTVFVEIPNYAKIAGPRKRALLAELANFVSSGKAAGKGRKKAPDGQALGLAAWVKLGHPGRDQAIRAIDLASQAGVGTVLIEGVKRKDADRAVSLAGLFDYFPPGLVAQILREGAKKGVKVRPANLPDTDTIARSTWVGLTTARSNGANLGKYGCFPLTLAETDHVVEQIQGWLKDWSAAPVFFVDQGLLREGAVDVGHDLARGLDIWLRTVAARGVRVVLIDTIDKATGKRLLRKDRKDDTGFLTASEYPARRGARARAGRQGAVGRRPRIARCVRDGEAGRVRHLRDERGGHHDSRGWQLRPRSVARRAEGAVEGSRAPHEDLDRSGLPLGARRRRRGADRSPRGEAARRARQQGRRGYGETKQVARVGLYDRLARLLEVAGAPGRGGLTWLERSRSRRTTSNG